MGWATTGCFVNFFLSENQKQKLVHASSFSPHAAAGSESSQNLIKREFQSGHLSVWSLHVLPLSAWVLQLHSTACEVNWELPLPCGELGVSLPPAAPDGPDCMEE